MRLWVCNRDELSNFREMCEDWNYMVDTFRYVETYAFEQLVSPNSSNTVSPATEHELYFGDDILLYVFKDSIDKIYSGVELPKHTQNDKIQFIIKMSGDIAHNIIRLQASMKSKATIKHVP